LATLGLTTGLSLTGALPSSADEVSIRLVSWTAAVDLKTVPGLTGLYPVADIDVTVDGGGGGLSGQNSVIGSVCYDASTGIEVFGSASAFWDPNFLVDGTTSTYRVSRMVGFTIPEVLCHMNSVTLHGKDGSTYVLRTEAEVNAAGLSMNYRIPAWRNPADAPAPTPTPSTREYVAIGDSYSSGEGAPNLDAGQQGFIIDRFDTNSNRCHRSVNAYSQQFRKLVGWSEGYTFAACSGAKIGDYYNSFKGESPQRSYLTEKTTLVSLGFGGNDAEFGPVLLDCVATPRCDKKYKLPMAALIKKNGPRLKLLYEDVSSNARNAEIYVMGYPRLFPENPGLLCNGIDRWEAKWMNQATFDLNAQINRQVAAIRKTNMRLHFVDAYNAFDGGELCAGSGTPLPGGTTDVPVYMNGVINDNKVYSFHPTAGGQAMLALKLRQAVSASGTN
jgi:hypothetical protein